MHFPIWKSIRIPPASFSYQDTLSESTAHLPDLRSSARTLLQLYLTGGLLLTNLLIMQN